MKIHDILQRDPETYPLVNQRQVRIADAKNGRTLEEESALLALVDSAKARARCRHCGRLFVTLIGKFGAV